MSDFTCITLWHSSNEKIVFFSTFIVWILSHCYFLKKQSYVNILGYNLSENRGRKWERLQAATCWWFISYLLAVFEMTYLLFSGWLKFLNNARVSLVSFLYLVLSVKLGCSSVEGVTSNQWSRASPAATQQIQPSWGTMPADRDRWEINIGLWCDTLTLSERTLWGRGRKGEEMVSCLWHNKSWGSRKNILEADASLSYKRKSLLAHRRETTARDPEYLVSP